MEDDFNKSLVELVKMYDNSDKGLMEFVKGYDGAEWFYPHLQPLALIPNAMCSVPYSSFTLLHLMWSTHCILYSVLL